MPTEGVQAAAMARLRAIFPGKEVPEATDFFISRHGHDPLSYGAYSGWEPGWKGSMWKTLIEPATVKGCPPNLHGANRPLTHMAVQFAGEAMCDNLGGYTHGAYISGREVVGNYLH